MLDIVIHHNTVKPRLSERKGGSLFRIRQFLDNPDAAAGTAGAVAAVAVAAAVAAVAAETSL